MFPRRPFGLGAFGARKPVETTPEEKKPDGIKVLFVGDGRPQRPSMRIFIIALTGHTLQMELYSPCILGELEEFIRNIPDAEGQKFEELEGALQTVQNVFGAPSSVPPITVSREVYRTDRLLPPLFRKSELIRRQKKIRHTQPRHEKRPKPNHRTHYNNRR